jgi:hypothetical protein
VLLHRIAALAVTVAVLGGAAIGVLAWRLAQGPLELPWLTRRVAAALNQDASFGQITIGSAALAWEGFRLGVGHSVDVRLTGFSLTDAAGRRILTVPRAEISLSFHGLLLGRTTLRAMEIDQARISLVRATDGSVLSVSGVSEPGTLEADTGKPAAGDAGAGAPGAADGGNLLALLRDLAEPPASDQSATRIGPFSQLLRLRIHDASLVVVDRQLGTTWRAPHANLDLIRGAKGGVEGSADLSLELGNQQARLAATATLPAGKGPIRLRVRLTPVSPAAIARVVPPTAPLGRFDAALSTVDAPVGGEADLQLDDAMRPVALHVALRAGDGLLHIANGVLPISGAAAVADATHDHAELRSLRLTVPGYPGAAASVVQAVGRVDRRADHLTASVGLDLDRVDFADLPREWPAGVAPNVRAWITANITAGVARDGHAELGLEAAPDFSDLTLTRATGRLAGDGLVVHWLRPVPPIENGSAVLNLLDPDTLEIVVRSGFQERSAGSAAGGAAADATELSVRGGRVRITGLMHHDQFASIEAQIAGTLPDAIALLHEPRLHLFDKHPLPLNEPAGAMTATLTMAFPLERDLTMDEVAIRAHAHLDGAHLGGVIAGRDLDQGALDLDVTETGLTLSGTAALAGIPADLRASMDFRAGGPSQVLQRISVGSRPSTRQLAAAGLDASAVIDGTLGLDAMLLERRDGSGDISITADLTPASVAVAALAWRKPAGAAMTASGHLTLSHDRLTGIDDLRVNGNGAIATGSVVCVDGEPSVVRLDRLVLGRTEASGTVRLPAAGGQTEAREPIAVTLTGPTLDLSARLAHQPTPHVSTGKPEPPSGPHVTLDARFDRVLMAADHQVTGLMVRLDSDGGVTRRLAIDGLTGPTTPFSLRIAPATEVVEGRGQGAGDRATPGKRTLTVTAADAGDLLAGLDIVKRMRGGQLSVTGSYDDSVPDHPLDGTAEIADFRLHDAPVLARLLQGMTLYGLVDVIRGPGLAFSRLVAPFRLTKDTLTLSDARAFNSSLGLTVRGTIDLDQERVALEGTIVPAYFFNSLLGNIPLVGRLFSPEQGGGLFAASYAVHGTLDDPDVTVNPLSALTPGFLRGVFGLF